MLTFDKDKTAGVFSGLYEKKEGESAKEVVVEPTLDRLAKSCNEALAEYLTLSKGLNSVFVLDREKFLQKKLIPAKMLLSVREKEFQRALLNDKEIGVSLFSTSEWVQSYEEVARELCSKSVSPLYTILFTISVVVLAALELLFSLNTVAAYSLSASVANVIMIATVLFLVGLFGARCILDNLEKNRVHSTTVSGTYYERYVEQRWKAIVESLRACVSSEVKDTIRQLCAAHEFKLVKKLDYSVPYEALASYLKDRELCERLSRESRSGLVDKIESAEPYELISASERLNVLKAYSLGAHYGSADLFKNIDIVSYGATDDLFRHIDLVSDVVAMREGGVL